MPWTDVFANTQVQGDPNTPLVTVNDFAEWFSIPTPDVTVTARIQTALEIASAAIRNSRRIFTPITSEVVLIDGSGQPSILLPRERLPVTSVTTVEELQTWQSPDYTTLDSTLYDWSEDGILVKNTWCVWTNRPRGVRVTYSHGYAVLPREVAGVCLAMAKRWYDNPDNQSVSAEQLGDHHVTYAANSSNNLLPDEAVLLSQYEMTA